MHSVKEIIREAESLPVEDRTTLINSLLRTLNTPKAKIDREWIGVAKRRLADLRSGRVKLIPGDKVFTKLQKRLGR
jgi:hypothetical protein